MIVLRRSRYSSHALQTHEQETEFDAATLVIVASICRELVAFPLAIELAASARSAAWARRAARCA